MSDTLSSPDGGHPSRTPAAPAAPPRRYPWYSWRRLGLNFLTISILAHLLFGFGATYLIVQTIQAKRKQTFAGSPQSPSAPTRAIEHKVQMQKQKQTMSAPAPSKRITTTSNSKVALPAMPAMPHTDAAIVPLAMAGMGGTGVGLGMGSSGGGSSGGGGGLSLFGFHGASGGLEGTFYDFKMEQNYRPVPGVDTSVFAKIVHDCVNAYGPWQVQSKYKHYTSPAKLQSRFFMFPAIQDTQAGASFQSPRSGPGSWLAFYKGRFSSTEAGTFRFVGFGDNVMMAKVGERTVLDASDHGYTGMKREAAGNIAFPGKDVTPLFYGLWFEMTPGTPQTLEIVVGDEGGIFCSGLFIQAKGTPYAQGDRGIPKLPIFALGPLTDADRRLLGSSLPAECLQNSTFRAEAPAPTSIFDH